MLEQCWHQQNNQIKMKINDLGELKTNTNKKKQKNLHLWMLLNITKLEGGYIYYIYGGLV